MFYHWIEFLGLELFASILFDLSLSNVIYIKKKLNKIILEIFPNGNCHK